MSEKIKNLIARTLHNPFFIKASENAIPDQLKFYAVKTQENEKIKVLINLIKPLYQKGIVIFVNTRTLAFDLSEDLRLTGFAVKALHGGMEQNVRDKMMTLFKNESVAVLVATDLAARGIDITSVSTIIHYELPDNEESFMHRSGRAGRAGREGLVYILASASDASKLKTWKSVKLEEWISSEEIKESKKDIAELDFATIQILGGKRDRLSKKDILGALIAETGLKADEIGKIDVQEKSSFVAIPLKYTSSIVSKLNEGRIKGRKFKVAAVK